MIRRDFTWANVLSHVILCLTLRVAYSVKVLEPNATIPYIPNVPLWLQLDFDSPSNECFSVFLDNKYVTNVCEENSWLENVVLPGEHVLELFYSHIPNAQQNGIRHFFHVEDPPEKIPFHYSPDGLTLQIPKFVDDYHKFWYDTGIW